MSRTPYWGDAPESWDKIRLGGYVLPGVAEISSGSLGYNEDVVQADGDSETRVNTLNYRPAEVEITVTMWEQAHLDSFSRIMKAYAPRKKLERRAVEVLHPWLEIYGVTHLYIFDTEMPRKVRTGLYEARLKLREFWHGSETSKGTGVKAVGEGVEAASLSEPTGTRESRNEATPPSEEEPPPPSTSTTRLSGGGW